MKIYVKNVKIILKPTADMADYFRICSKYDKCVGKGATFSAIANKIDIKYVYRTKLSGLCQFINGEPMVTEVYIDEKLVYANGIWQRRIEDSCCYELSKEEYDRLSGNKM